MEEQKDLTMLNRTVPKKPNGFLIFLLLLFIACICVGSFLLGRSFANEEDTPKQETKEEKKEEPKEEKEPAKKEEEKPSLSSQIILDTDKMLEEKGLLKQDMIEYRTMKVVKKGYFKNEPNVIIYTIEGKFKCKAGSNPENETTCLYQSQLGDPDSEGRYDYTIAIETTEENGKLVYGEFTEVMPGDEFVELNEKVE